MQQLQPNTTLQGGKYRIERVLGQGGFGNTYEGTNTIFDERVAIKEFFMQGINNRDGDTGSVSVSLEGNKQQFEEQREKFKKEALRIRKLNNPYIIKVHDLFEENGTAYYVMDYVDGENLAERLKRTGQPMTEQEVRMLLPQILDALRAVHDAGIWHLDLKPANIMVDKEGNVKLIDFGASKQFNAQKGGATTSTAISYTNGYAPREQMEQNYDKFGPWTDFYALGATLYTLLTNKRPPLPTDIDDDISEDKHLALPLPNSVSKEMKGYILWLMQTNRNRRPQSIAELETRMNLSKKTGIINVQEDDTERTIIANNQDEETILESTSFTETQSSSSYSNKTQIVEDNNKPEDNNMIKKIIYLILGLLVVSFIVYQCYSNQHQTPPANVVEEKSDSILPVEELVQEPIQESPTDIYKERIEQFVKSHSGIIVSYPEDNRYCVYFSKPLNGHKELYRYDAITDKTEKMNLPIEATWGYTDHWLTKNKRYIFIAAEERYTDFIRIDTETGQIKYITDCLLARRTKNGFKLVQSRCTNESDEPSSAEMEYAYTDYYYNEEGECTGHGEEYTTSPY